MRKSSLCEAESTENIVLDEHDFTDYMWADINDLRAVKHVGIEAEFIKAIAIVNSGIVRKLFATDTDKVDLSV